MTITYTIPGVPRLNQLLEASNPRMDCVFTSNAALATAYLHKPFTGTQIKALDTDDYGPNYTGGASERLLLDTMARLGITVTRQTSGTQGGLVSLIRQAVIHGRGVFVTMPSQWNSAVSVVGYDPRTYSGPTHVGLACGLGGNYGGSTGFIRVMNPWGGFWQDQTNSWWGKRLLKGEVWVATLTPQQVAPAALSTAPVAVSDTASRADFDALTAQIDQVIALLNTKRSGTWTQG